MRCLAPQPQKGIHMRMPRRPLPHSARQLLRPWSGTSAQQLLQQWQLSRAQLAVQAAQRCRLGLLPIDHCLQRCLLSPASTCCSLMLVAAPAAEQGASGK